MSCEIGIEQSRHLPAQIKTNKRNNKHVKHA